MYGESLVTSAIASFTKAISDLINLGKILEIELGVCMIRICKQKL